MEDRYLYKGKRVDNGDWIFGYLYRLSENTHPFIMLCGKCGESHEVDEHTICQCTGLRDKNGNLIWENDVAKDEKGNFYKPIWLHDYYQFSWTCIKSDTESLVGVIWNLWSVKGFEIEVIGNIFDDKELEKGE
jgi:uncharacterized phage protein (TIGR01671 family)